MGVAIQERIEAKPSLKAPLSLAYGFVLLFMVVYYARPEDWIPGLNLLHLAKVTGILALAAFLVQIGNVRQRWPREVIYLFLLLGQLWLTVPFATVWRGGAFKHVLDFSQVVPLILVIALAVNTFQRFTRILYVQVASVAAIACVAVIKFRHAAGRLEGVLNGNYANPNDLALAVIICIPICVAFFLWTRNRLSKIAWLCAIAVMLYTVILTASRGGMLALLVAMMVCLWEFAIKGRRRYLLVVVGFLGLCALLTSGGEVVKRFESIFNPVEENSYASAQQRRELLWKSIVVTAENPLFGVGPGNFAIISGVWRVTHNTYTQMSSEGGLPAFFLYILILWRASANLRYVRRFVRRGADLSLFASALRASLLAFLVGSFFADEGYQYFTYFLVVYTTVLFQIAKEENRLKRAIPRRQELASAEEGFDEQPREAAWSTL